MAIVLAGSWFAIEQSRAGQDLQRRATPPRVEWEFSADTERAYFSVRNSGMGPAYVHWFQLAVDGVPVRSLPEMFDRLGFHPDSFKYSILSKGWMAADQRRASSRVIVQVSKSDRSFELLRMQNNRIAMSSCYCSEIEDCWIGDGFARITPVRRCPTEGFVQLMDVAPAPQP